MFSHAIKSITLDTSLAVDIMPLTPVKIRMLEKNLMLGCTLPSRSSWSIYDKLVINRVFKTLSKTQTKGIIRFRGLINDIFVCLTPYKWYMHNHRLFVKSLLLKKNPLPFMKKWGKNKIRPLVYRKRLDV